MTDYRLNNNGWSDVTGIVLFDKIVNDIFSNSNVSYDCIWVYPEENNKNEVYKKISNVLTWYRNKKFIEIKLSNGEFDRRLVIKIIRK